MAHSVAVNWVGGSHLLRALGVDQFPVDELALYEDQLEALADLQDQFQQTCGRLSPRGIAALLRSGIAAPYYMPPPGQCPCPERYADAQSFDYGDYTSELGDGPLLGQLRQAMLAQRLRSDPFIRERFEMAMGGRMLPELSALGAILIQPFLSGCSTAGITGPYGPLTELFDQHRRAALTLGLGGYQGMALGGFARVLASMRGDFVPGEVGPYQREFGLGRSDGSDISYVLNDPSLTVEDKVCLMIMLIMKKMDEDIEKMAQEINKLQQQQSKKSGGKGKGGGGSSSEKSIDVETMKLKRLIDKRSQMFDMLRQIIDKYNQTAKGIIDSIGR